MIDMSTHEVKKHPLAVDDGQSQKLREIADWLSPTDYGSYQRHLEGIIAPGSEITVLRAHEYRKWVQRPGQTLHLRGSLGVGKTVTTSAIVHDLQTNLAAKKQLPVAFIYCGYQPGNERGPTEFLRSILKQLILAQSHVPQNVEELYDSHRPGSSLSYTQVFRVLSAVVSEYSRLFIAIDGLFEAHLSQNDRHRLLQSLCILQTSTNLNVLLTGEIDDSQSCIWANAVSIDIRAQETDIHAFFDMHKPRLPQRIIQDQNLQQKIKQAMAEVADGRFLMASLYMNFFTKPAPMQEIQDRLHMDLCRAKDFNDIYSDLIVSIATRAPEERRVANTLLLWLTFTNNPLSLFDLRHILGLQFSGDAVLMHDFTAERIISLCSGLVSMNEETGRIRFVHSTLRTYLLKRRSQEIPDGDDTITQLCMRCMTNLLTGTNTPSTTNTQRDLNNLFQYSQRNWGFHACRSTIVYTNQIIAFLDNTQVLHECGLQAILSDDHPEYAQATSSGFTKLHVMAFYGLTPTVEILLQRQEAIAKSFFTKAADFFLGRDSFLDACDVFGRTPLSFAAERGHSEIVSTLLAAGAGVDSLDQNSRTPLMFAAGAGHIETAEALLTARAYINAQDSAGRSPLSWAAASGHGDMIRFLLLRGALLDIPSWTHKSFLSPLLRRFQTVCPDVTEEPISGTPIIRASCNGHDQVVQMLIDEGANPDESDRDGRTGLSWAAANGHESTAQLLLDHKAKVDAIDSTGRTALSWAAENGHVPIAQLLLIRADSILEPKDNRGRTPALWAASSGQKGMLQLLFDSRADLTSRDNEGMSSFLLASINGHRATVEWLLSVPGISLEDRDNTGRTALSWAAGNGSLVMVESLLDKGVSVDTKDNAGLTTLSWAARRGHCHMIQLLFGRGGEALLQEIDNSKKTALHWAARKGHADALQILMSEDKHGLLQKQDNDGMTPLSLACENGHTAAAEVILATEPVRLLERKNSLGRTPLMLAVYGRHESLVGVLLAHGSTANTRDISGNVPLTIAIAHDSTTTAGLLLLHGADINIRSAQGHTPLSMAIAETSTTMVELLLSYGADLNVRLNHGRTPFMLAVERGSSSLVRLLLNHGVEIDTRDNRDQSALFIAVTNNDKSMVKLLLDGGAAVSMRDKQGATPVSIANGLGKRGAEVRELLMASKRVSPYADFTDSDISEPESI